MNSCIVDGSASWEMNKFAQKATSIRKAHTAGTQRDTSAPSTKQKARATVGVPRGLVGRQDMTFKELMLTIHSAVTDVWKLFQQSVWNDLVVIPDEKVAGRTNLEVHTER